MTLLRARDRRPNRPATCRPDRLFHSGSSLRASTTDFFFAAGGVAGALIGLPFVAISVSSHRFAQEYKQAPLYRIRARAALTAFINALAVSLSALIPGHQIGLAALIVASVGLAFVAASLLALIRLRLVRWRTGREVLFLLALVATFRRPTDPRSQRDRPTGRLRRSEHDCDPGDRLHLIGIARAWELIGGPSIGITQEVTALVSTHQHDPGDSKDEATPGS